MLNSNSHRFPRPWRWAAAAALVVAAALVWGVLREEWQASNLPQKGTNDMPGYNGNSLSGGSGTESLGSDTGNDQLGGSSSSSGRGPSGTTRDGLPYAPGQKPKLKTIPDVPDAPTIINPEPIDLAPLVDQAPRRRALMSGLGGVSSPQAGITG
jgi:hypothetical protein